MSKYEVFSGPIFPHSDRIRRDTEHLSVFSPNTGKYGPEKTPYLDTFMQCGGSLSDAVSYVPVGIYCSKPARKQQNMRNLFKVIDKETGITSMTSF